MKSRVSPASFARSCAAGLTIGTGMGLVFFALEPLALYHGALPYLGSPLVAIVAVYALFGAVGGLAAGVLAGAAAGAGLHPPVTTLVLTGWLFTTVFIARALTTDQLVAVPVRELLFSVVGLAVWITLGWGIGRGRRRSAGTGRGWWLGAAVSVVALAAMWLWTPLVYERFPERRVDSGVAPNVVMVVVDAMRPDHLSAYGYPRDTSPVMKRLADEGVRFDHAYSQGNRTAIAMPALFTSIYPSFNGAFAFQSELSPLPEERKTIAEMLREHGYRTVGMMSNIYLKTAFGLGQGFDRTEEFNSVRFRFSLYRLLALLNVIDKPAYVRGVSPSGTEVTDAALHWLRKLPKNGPYFMFVHYMDVHHEYNPPAEHAALFHSSPRVDAIDPDTLFAETRRLIENSPPIGLGDNERQRLIDLYDGCIHYADSEIGRLLEGVVAGDGRPTVVLLTADHGDEFMDHGSLYHVNLINQELLRVPLIVWSSDGSLGPRRVEGMARHIDVLPTIADLTGATIPSEAVGTSLVPLMDGTREDVAHVSFAEGDFCSAVIVDDWKLMHVDSTDAYLLYDLAGDPAGHADVSTQFPEMFHRLKELLDDHAARADEVKRSDRRKATDETIRQLRALGYVN